MRPSIPLEQEETENMYKKVYVSMVQQHLDSNPSPIRGFAFLSKISKSSVPHA